jgi:hypothetical protein
MYIDTATAVIQSACNAQILSARLIFRARSILLTHLACCTALSRSTRTAEQYGTRAKGSDGPTKTRGTTNRQGASKTTVCAKVEQCGGVPYPPKVTNFTPSLPLDRRGQGSQSTEFRELLRCVNVVQR